MRINESRLLGLWWMHLEGRSDIPPIAKSSHIFYITIGEEQRGISITLQYVNSSAIVWINNVRIFLSHLHRVYRNAQYPVLFIFSWYVRYVCICLLWGRPWRCPVFTLLWFRWELLIFKSRTFNSIYAQTYKIECVEFLDSLLWFCVYIRLKNVSFEHHECIPVRKRVHDLTYHKLRTFHSEKGP